VTPNATLEAAGNHSPHLSWQAGMRCTSARSCQASRPDAVASTHGKGPRPRVCAAAAV